MRYLIYAPLLLITACSNKPPGCADPSVVGLAKEIIEDNFVKKLDPKGTSRMQVEISLITEEGYNSDIGKWACAGRATLITSPEVLKAANDEIDLIRKITHPNAEQALTLGILRMTGQKVLTDEEEGFAATLRVRGWKNYTPDELNVSVNFSSQFEAGSKNLIVAVQGAAGLSQFPQLTRMAVERQERQTAAQNSAPVDSNPSQTTGTNTTAADDQALTVQVAKAELCGSEAFCITDATGATYRGNAFAIPDTDREYIIEAAKQKGTICLRGVSIDKIFDSAERC